MHSTALYIRISSDDENCDESFSIKNQRDLLFGYLHSSDSLLVTDNVLTFIDDGVSGTGFNRPGVQALLKAAHQGDIQCIIVKDLSRWGRNYPEVSEYLDQIFPSLGIRFISVNDSYDSEFYKGQTAPMHMAFNSILHDLYSKDLSYKIRQSFDIKRKNGEFVHGSPLFGYVKSTVVRNKLEIDEEAAAVVRRIFSLACAGKSNIQIATILNTEGSDTPVMYRKRKGYPLCGIGSAVGSRVYWTRGIVRRILVNDCYMGVMVSGKTRSSRIGNQGVEYLPKNEWTRIENSHEPIITEDIFLQANKNIRHTKKQLPTKRRALFTGKLKCGHCKKALVHTAVKEPYYHCAGSRLGSGLGCFGSKIYVGDLSELILAIVKTEAKKVPDSAHEDYILNALRIEVALNLVNHITVYDVNRIEISFNFTDTNM